MADPITRNPQFAQGANSVPLERILEVILSILPGSGEAMSAHSAGKSSGELMHALSAGRPVEAAGAGARTLTDFLGAIPLLGAGVRGIKGGTRGGLKLLKGGGHDQAELNDLTDLVNKLELEANNAAFEASRVDQLIDLSTKGVKGGADMSDDALAAAIGQQRFSEPDLFDTLGALLQKDISTPRGAVTAVRGKQAELKKLNKQTEDLFAEMNAARGKRKGIVEQKHQARIDRVKAEENTKRKVMSGRVSKKGRFGVDLQPGARGKLQFKERQSIQQEVNKMRFKTRADAEKFIKDNPNKHLQISEIFSE